MKKYLLIVLITITFSVLLISCSGGVVNLVKNNMSDIRFTYFEGQSLEYSCSLSCGLREEVYEYNGISTKNVECGVVSLAFKEAKNFIFLEIELFVNNEKIECILELSPYENEYMGDIQKNIPNNADVRIKLKDQSQEPSLLHPVSNIWEIDCDKALKIGVDYYKDTIKALYFNKVFHGECYLKPISKFGYNKIFWYFSVIDMGSNIKNCLIDVNTGQIIS